MLKAQTDAKPALKEPDLDSLLDEAWRISRRIHGNRLSVHIPGMFVVNGRRGRYRAVSITGDRCDLDCEHCKGSLLKTMAHALDAEALVRLGLEAARRGDHGMLITGGCDREGRLPWSDFLPAIGRLKETTNLALSIHAGQVDAETARNLKAAGVDQTLVDVIGDPATARDIYHLEGGTAPIRRTLDALADAELETVPHILFGIHYGMERGERLALKMLRQYPLKQYVVVVLMPARGTPMEAVRPPEPEKVAAFLADARKELPHLRASLGCARPRGLYGRKLDVLAVKAGVNALALPSDAALLEAEARGLEIVHAETCCSLAVQTR